MPLPSVIEKSFQKIADFLYGYLPARIPSEKKLGQCRLVAHRGEHDNSTTMENTLAAFEKAEAAGVWGIECDVHWTNDHIPVVNHDPNLQRLHGHSMDIAHISFKDLKACCPQVPSLETVVKRFGGHVHLMIEIKKTPNNINNATIRRRYDTLQEVLSPLRPINDFHLMTLHPKTLAPIDRIPRQAFTAIAYNLPKQLNDWVRQNGWGGICGHYLLMSPAQVKEHQEHGRRVGTGFAASRNVLFREINRGVDWIFSNNAVAMQRVIHQARKTEA